MRRQRLVWVIGAFAAACLRPACAQAPAAPAAPAVAADPVRVAALEAREKELAQRVTDTQNLLAEQREPNAKANIEKQLAKFRAQLEEVRKELGTLRGPKEAKPGDKPGDELDEATRKQIKEVQDTILGVINRMKLRSAEIKKEEALQPAAAQTTTRPGMRTPGTPTPGAPTPVAPVGPGVVPGAPGGEGGPNVGQTRLDRLIFEQQEDLAYLSRLRERLKELKAPPKPINIFDQDQTALHPLLLYSGKPLEKNPFKLAVGGWGSGTVTDSDYGILEGARSLAVRTDGYYRGARLDFAEPPNIKLYFEKPKVSYFEMDVYFFPKSTTATGAGGTEATPGGPGAAPPGPGLLPGGPGMAVGGAPVVGGPVPIAPGTVLAPGAPTRTPTLGGRGPGGPGTPGAPGGPGARMPGARMPTAGPGGVAPPGAGPGGVALPGRGPGGVVLPGTPAIGGAGMNPDATLVPPPGGEGAPPPGAEQPPVDNGGAQGAGPKSPPATQKLRIIFDTDRGPIAAEDVTFDYTYEVNEGWTRIFVPMTAFTNPSERVPNQLKRLALFGDQKDAFYVGMIRFVADEVPIKPTIIGAKKMSAVVGQQFTLDCVVDAGLSAVDYVWDWGDGSQDEVKEPRASHIYVKAGTYTVTLTARDVDGLKEPGKYTCTIVAQPFADEPANPNPGEAAGGRIPGGPAIGAPGTPMPPRGPRTGGRTRVE